MKAILNGGALLVGLVAITISLIGLHRINTRCGAAPTPTASIDPEWASKELDAKVAVANVQLEQAGRVFVKPFVCTLKPSVWSNYECNKALDTEMRRLSTPPPADMADAQPSFAHGCLGEGCAPQPWVGETCSTPGHLMPCTPEPPRARMSSPTVMCPDGRMNCASDILQWEVN